MVAWVVLDRRHYRQAGPFALPLSTPLFPLLHLSPLLPYSYGHPYTTATHQPLYNQSLTHSFYLDGGCTPPARSPLATAIPTHYPLPTSSSFFSLAYALFHKNTRGGVPLKSPARSRGQAAVVLLGFRPILFTEGRIH